MFWADFAQARDRLSRSYVTFEGRPFFVNSVDVVDGDMEAVVAHGAFVGERNNRTISLEDPGWNNFRNIGCPSFINTVDSLFFMYRNPVRSVKHGLTPENTSIYLFNRRE